MEATRAVTERRVDCTFRSLHVEQLSLEAPRRDRLWTGCWDEEGGGGSC